MIEKRYLDIIVCPICKGKLSIKKNIIDCTNCKRKYYIRNEIPVLLSGEIPIEYNISKEKWDFLYERRNLEQDYTSNKNVVSVDKFLSKYKKFYSKGIFLDLGCGIAWNGALLAKRGVSFLGLDISYEGIYKSKLLFLQEKLRGCFVQATFKNLPFKDNSIQFIYAGLSILQYEKDMSAALLEAYRVLNPGSRMVATFPVGSLTTLTYHQLRGDIPNVPLIGLLAEFIHIKLFKGRYLRYGYGRTSFIKDIKKNFSKTPFKIVDIDYFDTFYPINFIPSVLKPFIRRMLKLRPFWPVAYVEVIKLPI